MSNMKLHTSQRYIEDLHAASRKYGRMQDLFDSFRSGASLLAAPGYRLSGITIESIPPAKFIARFLGKAVEFTFSYDHAASHGVVAVTSLSPDGDAIGPIWSFHFNEQGEVGDIEPRPNEGVYNVRIETDAADIVLGALHIALTGTMEVL